MQVAAKVAHDTVLFGSVGARDIVKALTAGGFDITNNQVHLHENFKELGRFEVEIGLHKGVNATVKIEIVNSDPDAPSLDETLKAAQQPAAAAEEAEAAAE